MTTLRENYPFYLANEPKQSGKTIDLIDKFTGSTVSKIEIADALTIDGAIAAAFESAPALAAMASYERQNVLQHCVNSSKKDMKKSLKFSVLQPENL